MKSINDYDTKNVVLCYFLLVFSIVICFFVVYNKIMLDKVLFKDVKKLKTTVHFSSIGEKVIFNSFGEDVSREFYRDNKFKQFECLNRNREREKSLEKKRATYAKNKAAFEATQASQPESI